MENQELYAGIPLSGVLYYNEGRTVVTWHRSPTEEDIRHCYDVCNKLFAGKDHCFYKSYEESIGISEKDDEKDK